MDLEKRIAELEVANKELAAKNVELTEAMASAKTKAEADVADVNTKLVAANKELAEKATATREASIKAFMEKAKNEGKVVPANEKQIEALLRSVSDTQDIKFSAEEGKETMLSASELLKNFVEALPKLADMKEYSVKGEKSKVKATEGEGTENSRKLDALVKEYQEKNKDASYKTALIAVSQEHADLCEASKE